MGWSGICGRGGRGAGNSLDRERSEERECTYMLGLRCRCRWIGRLASPCRLGLVSS